MEKKDIVLCASTAWDRSLDHQIKLLHYYQHFHISKIIWIVADEIEMQACDLKVICRWKASKPSELSPVCPSVHNSWVITLVMILFIYKCILIYRGWLESIQIKRQLKVLVDYSVSKSKTFLPLHVFASLQFNFLSMMQKMKSAVFTDWTNQI